MKTIKGDEMSCVCQRCGFQYRIDIIIHDDIWEIIKPPGKHKHKESGLLCGQCIIASLEFKGEYRSFELKSIESLRKNNPVTETKSFHEQHKKQQYILMLKNHIKFLENWKNENN